MNHTLKFLILAILLLPRIGQAQCPFATAPYIQFSLSYDAATQKFTAWYVPSVSQTNRLVTAQFTIISPNGYTTPLPNGRDSEFQITNINGAWDDFTVDHELIATVGQTGPASLNGLTVHQVGMAPAGNDVDPDGSGPLPVLASVTAGVPVPLFSFPSSGCAGTLRVLVEDEQVQQDLLGQFGFNINNEMSIQSPVQAFQPAINRYCGNSNSVVTTVLPDIEATTITAACPAQTFSNNYFTQVLSNWDPTSLPAGTFEATNKVWGNFTVTPTSMQSNVTIDAVTGAYTVNFPTANGTVIPASVSICNTLSDGCNTASDNACVVISAPECPLPVNFISFEGKAGGRKIELTWKTASERNAGTFIIERSRNSTEFAQIGKSTAMGESNQKQTYSFTDHAPLNGPNYYRLQQIDQDGTRQFTRIIAINYNPELPAITVLGNPVQAGVINLQLYNLNSASLRLTDIQGKRIPFKTKDQTNGQVSLHTSTPLRTGIYLLGADHVPSFKIIVP